MIGTGVKNQFLTKGPESALNFFALAETLLGQLGQYESQMYKSLTKTSSQSVVDRISTGSTQLDGHAIMDFTVSSIHRRAVSDTPYKVG